VDCHYPPQAREAIWIKIQTVNSVVQYLTNKYSSKPYAQVEDASCLRSGCHAKEILKGKITFKKGIAFDHKFHLGDLRRGKQLRCTSCHSQMVVGNHMEVTQATCYLCHFRHAEGQKGTLPLGDCTTCHEPPKGEIKIGGFTFNHRDFTGTRHVACEKCHLDVVQGDGHAPKERCYICHNQPERLAKYDDVTFMHDSHVAKRKVACTQCHVEIKHGLTGAKTRVMDFSCQSCHADTHLGPKEMFMGEGGKGVPPTPSHMFTARLDCLACHVQSKSGEGMFKNGRTFVASEKACTSCHGDKYKGMLQDWKETLDEMVRDIEPKLAAARQAMEKGSAGKGKSAEAKKLYDDAKYNVDFVKIGRGVHNPFYASELIQVADRNLDRLFRLAGQTASSLPEKSPIRGGYCASLCHAKEGVKLPQETSFQGAKLPHTRHAFDFGLGCTTCHSAEKHKAIKIRKEDCMACHHGPENTQCSRCHQNQAALFTAQKLPIEVREAKASVKAGKVECVGCHDLSKKQTLDRLSQACTQCHDKAYVEMLKGWREETLDSLKKTKESLDRAGRKLADAGKAKRDSREAAAALERAKKAYAFVAKAKGVHNPDLSAQILEQAQKDVQRAEEMLAGTAKSGK
jgi:hypothetical protein